MKLWDWWKWQWSGKVIVSDIEIEFTMFSRDTKLESIVTVPWKMPKKPILIGYKYEDKLEYIKQRLEKQEKKIRKISMIILKDEKKKKWCHNRRQHFPSKYLIGIEWDLNIKTRQLTFEEWKQIKGDGK